MTEDVVEQHVPVPVRTAASRFPPLTQPVLQQWVFAMYGAVMLQVQAFEQQLAALDLLVTAQPMTETTPKGIQRRLEKQFVKIRHLVQKATPEAITRELSGRIDDGLLDEIKFLIQWRNRLAHSYLRQRLVTVPGEKINASPDIAAELLDISIAFTSANDRIEAAKNAAMADWQEPASSMPTPLRGTMTLLLTDLWFAKAPRFEPYSPGGDA